MEKKHFSIDADMSQLLDIFAYLTEKKMAFRFVPFALIGDEHFLTTENLSDEVVEDFIKFSQRRGAQVVPTYFE